MPTFDVLVAISLIVSLSLYLRRQNNLSHSRLPPGPKPLPILGNIFDLPTSLEHETYARWGEQYGDVVHVNAFGQRIIILNSVQAANDLLDVRSAIYSDRPFIPMLHEPELMDSGWVFTFKQYSEDWRRHRRMFALLLGPVPARAFFHTQARSAHTLLRSILQTPERFAAHLRHAATETIMSITYGYQIKPMDDPWVELADQTIRAISEGARPGAFLVNIFPWLKYVPAWLPGTSFKKHAEMTKKLVHDLLELPFEDAKKRIEMGTAAPSFVTNALTDESSVDSMVDIKEVAATMFGAAADTSVSVSHFCVLAFVLHPTVQERAQSELDVILGRVDSPSFRLPTIEDRPRLPYIDAILQECFRWHPVLPLGIAHAVIEDDVYRGWKIPKGTFVIANAWAMLRDEKIYKEPLSFRPERFLGNSPEPHPDETGCFGFGRRQCPGRHLADASIWIQIACMLASFTFSPAKDAEGRDIDVGYARSSPPGVVSHPAPFPCIITPRSKEVEMRIRETQ